MGKKETWLVALWLLAAANLAQGNIVVLKRSPGLTDNRGISASFQAAMSDGTVTVCTGPGVIADTGTMYTDQGWAQSEIYKNFGASTAASSWGTCLVKFGLDALPGFAGGKVTKAELRFYTAGGNSGVGDFGRITFSDWIEGTANDGFPGAAGGVSGAHPTGCNTDAFQTAGGTPVNVGWPPNMSIAPFSWANNQPFAPAKDAVVDGHGAEYNPWGVTTGQWDQYVTLDVTSILQNWANGAKNYGMFVSNGNYGFFMSEETTNPDWQPILFVDYQPHGDPETITDLAAGNPDWFKIDLSWTAPSANPPAPVASYDIRYSTSPITDDASFSAALHCTCKVPAPAAPGTAEHFTITGLSPNMTYYFAIKSTDIVGTVSVLSNAPVSATTLPMDVTPPAQITTLAAPTVKPNYATLTWSAVGDDGLTGQASDYDFRYSTTPITSDAAFNAATRAVTPGAPKTPGQQESLTIHGLAPSTTYYFAIKAGDEVPNWSPMSNVLTFRTLDADQSAPNAVTDLSLSMGITVAYVFWTAPTDNGTAGLASYDLRYSTAPITEANWSSATQVPGEPAPSTPGARQTCLVSGLTASTTYYFAIKSLDYAEPANVSPISNIASATTLPPVVPVTVHNPWLANDRVADTHNINTMAATYANAYTPDGVVPPTTDEQKAINIYNNQKRRLYHWADEPPGVGGFIIEDPTYTQNVFGWALCGRHAAMGMTISKYAGFSDTRGVGIPGHNIYEVFYDGGWHLFDTMTTMYVYTKGTSPHVACLAEISADHTIMTNAVADNRACPGYLLCGDDPVWYSDGADHWGDGGHNVSPTNWNGNMDLRLGQAFKRTWEAWQNECPTPRTDADNGNIAGPDAPYHHECSHDWQDYVNFPYWEPYGKVISYIHTTKATYRRWANGTDVLAPDFRSAAYQSLLESTSHDLASFNDDGISPDLHAETIGTTAEAIFKVGVPFYITDASFSGDFVRTNTSDTCNVQVSADGNNWTTVWGATASGTTHVDSQSLRTSVFGLWQNYWVKIQIKATTSKADAGVSNFVLTTIFEHNKGAMAYLDKGVNNITLTFDNATELAASGNSLHVLYKWKEYDGTNWTIDRQYETFTNSSPTTFAITTGGTKVPRTESILLEVVAPHVDVPPSPIQDLAAPTTGIQRNSIQLTWTATGEDNTTGTASRYDLRYSTSPITNMADFNAATQVAEVPSPKAAGSAESFTVTGLTTGTTYYFAIVAYDKANNASGLSNVLATFTRKIGDIDIDGQVNLADLKLLIAAWNSEGGGAYANWNPDADLDGDNAVNLSDLKILIAHWNT